MGVNKQILIKSFPADRKMSEEDFELVESEIPKPSEGEVLIKNLWLSIEAGQRTHLSTVVEDFEESITGAIPMARPGRLLPGMAVGEVVESRNAGLPVGTFVLGWLGWQNYVTTDGSGLQVVDPEIAPLPSYLGTLGLWGATAYYGLFDVGKIQPGEIVVVSAAAGAVGMVAVQLAKQHGCRVVAIAGSDEKATWLVEEVGADSAINYKTASTLQTALETTCPEGIDVYFDGVGGSVLEAAIDVLKPHGRIVAAGTVAQYDDGASVAPRNYFLITPKRLTILGFTVIDYVARLPEFQSVMAPRLSEGSIIDRQTIYEGIANAPRAWIDLFRGKNIGKMLVRLDEP